MNETARELFERMRPDLEARAWAMDGPNIDLRAKYQDAIREVGPAAFLAQLFLQFGDSTLTRVLNCMRFAWRDLPFSAWKEVLHLVAWSEPAVYQLVWSAADLLGVDMVRVILDEPNVDPVARHAAQTTFPNGPPRARAWSTGEPITPEVIPPLWRRLAAEGAPMIHDDAP